MSNVIQVIFRVVKAYTYIHTIVYTYIYTRARNKKEVTHFKENKKGHMGRFGGRRGRNNVIIS